MTAGRYLDPVAFTALFRHRRKNHAQICQGLQLLAAGVARRFWFASPDDRHDIQSNALIAAVERIDRFKFGRGKDAFVYYTSLLYNAILRQLRRMKLTNGRARVFTDLDFSFMLDRDESTAEIHNQIMDLGVPYARAS